MSGSLSQVQQTRDMLVQILKSLGPQKAALVSLLSSSSGLWVVSLILKDVSIVDSFWSLGFVLSALVYRIKSFKVYSVSSIRGKSPLSPSKKQEPPKRFVDKLKTFFSDRANLTTVLVAIWGVRLSAYLTWRNHGIGEDYRYVAIRKASGKFFPIQSIITIFWFQAILCWIISQPLLKIMQSKFPSKLTNLDKLGTLLWCIGFFFETVGDLQLAKFKSNPSNKGKLLTTGLWKYTRHPNYFGNACMFWGFYLIACSVRNGWTTLYSPSLMTFLLLKVSGVSLLEKSLSKRKPGFQYYQQSTSSFIPWFPAK